MSVNADFEKMKVEVETGLIDQYELVDPARFFQAVPVGAGKQYIEEFFAKMPQIPQATRDSVAGLIDKFAQEKGTYAVPRHRLTIVMTEDEMRTIMASGKYEKWVKNAAKSLSLGVMKTVFQNQLGSAAGMNLYYALGDVGTGNGTFDRPLVCGSTTKVTGAWTTALIAANSAAALKGRLITHDQFNDGTGLIMFYPNCVEAVMEGREPSMSVPTDIRDIFTKKFAECVPIPVDESSLSIMTGNAETATDFDMIACNPRWFIWLYEQAPSVTLERNPNQTGATLTFIHNAGLMPIPVLEADGKVYKAMQSILASGT